MYGDLPAKKQAERHQNQAPGMGMSDEHQRGEHHGKIPVVDPTDGTAAILHKPGLKGTEEQNADHIAHAVGQAKEDENTCVDHVKVIKDAKDAVAE